MPSTYSPDLRIELIANGEQSGTWGTTTNNNLGTLIEDAISATASVSVTSAAQALTALNGAADQSRCASLLLTTITTDNFAVYVPPTAQKLYVVYNNSSYIATVYCSTVLGNTTAAGTGVSIPAGKKVLLRSDGTNITEQMNHIVGSFSVGGDVTAGSARLSATYSQPAGTTATFTVTNTYSASDVVYIATTSGTFPSGVYTITGATSANFTVTAASVATTITGNALITDDALTINSIIQPGVIIDGSSTLPALRVTQTGSGNALLIDDSTNPDVTPFAVNASGQVGIGVASPATNLDLSGGAAASFAVQVSRANGTAATPTVVASGDDLLTVTARGYDGTNYINAAQILMEVGGTPGTNDMPGAIAFSTTSDGASSLTEKVRITSEGAVGVGTATPTTALEISGSTNQAASGTASSISGTTLTVGGTVVSGFAVGQVIWGTNVAPNTYITALGSGTGGAGTYTVSVSQTVASTTIYAVSAQYNRIRITDTDTAVTANQPVGTLEFYGSDASTPGASVKGFIQTLNESTTPDSALIFGTYDNGSGNVTATEKLRVSSSGLAYGTYSTMGNGVIPLQSYYRLASDYAGANVTTAQNIFGVGVPLAASTTYAFEMVFVLLKTAGTTSHTISLSFDIGSGTFVDMDYLLTGVFRNNPTTTIAVPDVVLYSQVATATPITGALAVAAINFTGLVKGTFSVGTAGTWTPRYTLSAAPGGAYSTLAGSYVNVYPLGPSGAAINIGGWV
jgi:hypothetical protein